jgi:predicted RNase H-like nuclease (RuvC/YqgF family)
MRVREFRRAHNFASVNKRCARLVDVQQDGGAGFVAINSAHDVAEKEKDVARRAQTLPCNSHVVQGTRKDGLKWGTVAMTIGPRTGSEVSPIEQVSHPLCWPSPLRAVAAVMSRLDGPS